MLKLFFVLMIIGHLHTFDLNSKDKAFNKEDNLINLQILHNALSEEIDEIKAYNFNTIEVPVTEEKAYYIYWKLENIGQGMLHFDDATINTANSHVGMNLKGKDTRNKEDYVNAPQLSYYIIKSGRDNANYYIDTREYGKSKKTVYLLLTVYPKKNIEKFNISFIDMSVKESSTLSKTTFDYTIPQVFVLENSSHTVFGLNKNLILNSYETLQNEYFLDTYISYDFPLFKRPTINTDYIKIKVGYPETLPINLNKLISKGKLFISIFKSEDINNKSINIDFQLKFYDYNIQSVEFQDSFIHNYFSAFKLNTQICFRPNKDGNFAYFHRQIEGDGFVYIPSNNLNISNFEYNSLSFKKLITKQVSKGSLEFLKFVPSNDFNSGEVYISEIQQITNKKIKYEVDSIKAYSLNTEILSIDLEPLTEFTESYEFKIFVSKDSSLKFDSIDTPTTVTEDNPYILTVGKNDINKYNKLSISSIFADCIIMIITKKGVLTDQILSKELTKIESNELNYSKTIAFPIESISSNNHVFQILSTKGVITSFSYNIIKDYRTDKTSNSIFNFYPLSYIAKTDSSMISINYLINSNPSNYLFIFKVNYSNSTANTDFIKDSPSTLFISYNNLNSIQMQSDTQLKFDTNYVYFYKNDLSSNILVFNHSSNNCYFKKFKDAIYYELSLPLEYKENIDLELIICPIDNKTYIKQSNNSVKTPKDRNISNIRINLSDIILSIDQMEDTAYYIIKENPEINSAYTLDYFINLPNKNDYKVDFKYNQNDKTNDIISKFEIKEKESIIFNLYSYNTKDEYYWDFDKIELNYDDIKKPEIEEKSNTLLIIIILVSIFIVFIVGFFIVKYCFEKHLRGKEDESLINKE